MAINDLYTDGLASGWKITDASTLGADETLEADVVIVGSGAGGGTAAEILAEAGLKVLIVEEGPLKTAASFKDMDESRAYADLYQEAAGRSSSDGAIGVLQGRSVGGTTTVNWTSSFRTPEQTLEHWAQSTELKNSRAADMLPWFEKMEARLGIGDWVVPPNENNAILKRGAEKLGWAVHSIPRNVRGCWNLGYCGLGCPTNAKQSSLVTTIPGALKRGAELVHRLRVQRIVFKDKQVQGLDGIGLGTDGVTPTGIRVSIKARHYVLAGGAINTPALLIRSKASDPHLRIGKGTCIHPVNLTVAQMPDKVEGYYGAPQSTYSDEFQWKNGVTGSVGYKMEVAPMHPAFVSLVLGRYGESLKAAMSQLPYTQSMLALLRDGFDEGAPGGTIDVDSSGAPLLHYDLTSHLFDAFKRAYLSMAELQFAAGAKAVMPVHMDTGFVNSWTEAKKVIEGLKYEKQRLPVFTAHLMGGCAMGEHERNSVINSEGRFHYADNLSVFDGSMFPTSIGANPQHSIYGFVCRNATTLAGQLKV
jgi:choline dehydrogenase